MGNMIALPFPLIVIREICSEGKAESVYSRSLCEIDKIFSQKKEAVENPPVEQPFSEKFDQQRSELLEKDKLIEELKNEIEKLKVELAQAQLLIMEKEEFACIPSETRATVRLPDNTGNSVHSHIMGNGDSLDRDRGVTVSLGGEKMIFQSRWNKPITAYLPREKRALTFSSEDERRKAVHLCWHDPDLIGVPRGIANGLTLVFPKEAVPYFESKGIKFSVSFVLSQDELTLEERRRLRHEYGM